jgi:ribonuclease D
MSYYHNSKPSMLQISSKTDAFLIDLFYLASNKKLDEVLSRVFRSENTVVIGFGFSSDIDMFSRKHPQMGFIKYIRKFIDAQSYFGKLFLVEQPRGLAKVAMELLGKQICKVEQLSNWERRPLRLS